MEVMAENRHDLSIPRYYISLTNNRKFWWVYSRMFVKYTDTDWLGTSIFAIAQKELNFVILDRPGTGMVFTRMIRHLHGLEKRLSGLL